jgi:hypothetical protein
MPKPEELKKMLHNMCGCSGPIEGAQAPLMSSSCMNVVISEKRKAMNLDIDREPRQKTPQANAEDVSFLTKLFGLAKSVNEKNEGDAESAGRN